MRVSTRPEKKRPWNHVFYLDFEDYRTDTQIKDVLDAIEERFIYVKVLGSYRKAS